jgi:tetratricopeptide (TPR) repeat protein
MAGLALDQQDLSTAGLLLEEARPAALEALVQGAWNYQQGRLSLARGDSVKARQFFEDALTADRKILNRTGMGADLQGLGKVWEDQGDFEKSFLYYSRAFDLYASTNSREKAHICLDTLRRINQAGRLGHSLKPFERQLESKRAAEAPCLPQAGSAELGKEKTAPEQLETTKPRNTEACAPGSKPTESDQKRD